MVVSNDRDDLKKLGIAGGSEIQARVVLLLVNAHRIVHRVFDVLVSNAMFRADSWISTEEL
jgi:hypothetical protein